MHGSFRMQINFAPPQDPTRHPQQAVFGATVSCNRQLSWREVYSSLQIGPVLYWFVATILISESVFFLLTNRITLPSPSSTLNVTPNSIAFKLQSNCGKLAVRPPASSWDLSEKDLECRPEEMRRHAAEIHCEVAGTDLRWTSRFAGFLCRHTRSILFGRPSAPFLRPWLPSDK